MDETESDIETLRMEYESVVSRLGQQSETVSEFGSQGLKMVRILLLGVGALITVSANFDLLQQTPECVIYSSNFCMSSKSLASISIGFLLASTTLYTVSSGKDASGLHNTTTAEDVSSVLTRDFSEREYLEWKLAQYKKRISDNDQTISASEKLLGAAGSLLLFCIFSFSVVGYSIATGTSVGVFEFSAWVVFMLVVYTYLLITYPRHFWAQELWIFGKNSSNPNVEQTNPVDEPRPLNKSQEK